MVFRFLNRAPFNGAGAAPSPRPVMRGSSPRETQLQRELDALRAEQAALARQERAAAANLADMQDALDVLAGEIDVLARRTRDPALRENGAAMITNVKAWASREGGVGRNTARAVTQAIKIALGVERSPWAGPAPAAAPAQPVAVADPQSIVDAGAKLRGDSMSTDVRTGQPRPLPSPLAKIDPAAAGIVRAGNRARNEPDE
jgi:hypothetical protein